MKIRFISGVVVILSIALFASCSMFNQVIAKKNPDTATPSEPDTKSQPESEPVDESPIDNPCIIIPDKLHENENNERLVLISWHFNEANHSCTASYASGKTDHILDLQIRKAEKGELLDRINGDEFFEAKDGQKVRFRSFSNLSHPEIIESAHLDTIIEGWFVQVRIDSLFDSKNELHELYEDAIYLCGYTVGIFEGFNRIEEKELIEKRLTSMRQSRMNDGKKNQTEAVSILKQKDLETLKVKREIKEREFQKKAALDKYCEAFCEIKNAKDTIDYEKRIGKKVGYVNAHALYEAGETIVSWEDELEERKAEYKSLSGKYPRPDQCVCY